MAPVLIALDAQARVVGPNGERVFPLGKLYTQDGKKPLTFRKGEILREILLPHPSGKTLYLKWRRRESIEFPIVSLALHIEKDGNKQIKKARIILSAVGSGPVETLEAEKMLKNASLGIKPSRRSQIRSSGKSRQCEPPSILLLIKER
jgi:xanthine dehydrogenase YagS FAD-binding subunit